MKNFIFILFFLEIFCVSEMRAESIERVKDGDTVVIKDANPPKEFLQNIGRIDGIDSPESYRPKCLKEKNLGLKAKKFTKDFIEKKGDLKIIYNRSKETKEGWDKYGRYLIEIKKDGKDLAEELVKVGLAVYYDGGTKIKNWCE